MTHEPPSVAQRAWPLSIENTYHYTGISVALSTEMRLWKKCFMHCWDFLSKLGIDEMMEGAEWDKVYFGWHKTCSIDLNDRLPENALGQSQSITKFEKSSASSFGFFVLIPCEGAVRPTAQIWLGNPATNLISPPQSRRRSFSSHNAADGHTICIVFSGRLLAQWAGLCLEA